ncbi:MAG TPA: NAD(P)-dependent oxidoreductase [Vicinamibacterales bacterium]|nr:NAD(P)-dependent oxidoreductase [Vicinamibacterales bacterium]
MSDAVGFIGLGAMGRPMALNLRKHDVTLVVHNRSEAAERALVKAGASVATNPAAVASACQMVVTMLPDAPDVAAVLEGQRGLLETLQPGTIVVDASTIAPDAARRFAAAVAARGGHYLDAPVSGGEIGATDGTLTFMVGGDAEALDRVRPLLALMGKDERIVHVGPSGAGQVCKACNQLVIGGTMLAVAEAMALARKSGVDGAKVRQALLGGFAASRVLEVHGERMLTSNYKPGFKARLYKKDLRIVAEALAAQGVAAPGAALVQQLVHAQLTAGGGEDDYSGVASVIFRLAGLD